MVEDVTFVMNFKFLEVNLHVVLPEETITLKGIFHVTVRMSYTSLLVKHVLNSMLVLLSVLRIVLGCIKVTSIREK